MENETRCGVAPPRAALSIIVPVLNEAGALPRLLDHLQPFSDRGCEVIVVDGGSTDESAALVRRAGFICIPSSRGRGAQMNVGAAHSRGEVLLFLHADTSLPPKADRLVVEALARPCSGWGRFDLCIDGRSRMLPVIALAINLRSRWTEIATGDQALFVKRILFEAVKGFPEQPLMEDIELCKRLRRTGPPAFIRAKVTTSGRRWDARGAWATIFLMWWLRASYWTGVPAEDLARRYK